MSSRDQERARLALYRMAPSRKDLMFRYTGGNAPTIVDIRTVNRVLACLADTIAGNERTELRGLGVFQWKPAAGRLPTGDKYTSYRMIFKFNQKRRPFNGDR